VTKQVAGCTTATLTTYRLWLARVTAAVSTPTPAKESTEEET